LNRTEESVFYKKSGNDHLILSVPEFGWRLAGEFFENGIESCFRIKACFKADG
jgi:hypothetical protein